MKQHTRELLVTTKVAQHWHDDFDQKVDELIAIVNKIDNDKQVQHATQILDVYHNAAHDAEKTTRKKKIIKQQRPFEFLVFRN